MISLAFMTSAVVSDIHCASKVSGSKRCQEALSLTGNFSSALLQHGATTAVVLGDLCQANNRFTDLNNISAVRSAMPEKSLPVHYIPGNHELKNLTTAEAEKALGLKSAYYSVNQDGMHFVFLTPQTVHYPNVQISIDQDQITWLKADLKKTKLPTIVFIHEPISEHNCFGNPRYSAWPNWALVYNRKEIRKILAKAGKVVAVLQGHLHRNSLENHSGIPYLTLQSLVETVSGNKPAGTYCLTDLDSSGHLNFRIYGNDLTLRADFRNSAHKVAKITPDDISAVYNQNSLATLGAILQSFKPEVSFLEGQQLDYDQEFGRVVKISADIPATRTSARRPFKANQYDYYKHGLLTTLDAKELTTVFAKAKQTLNPRGILQIDFLAGDPYLHIKTSTRLSHHRRDYSSSQTMVPLHNEETIIELARLHGFRHLSTLRLTDRATVLGVSGEVRCGVFVNKC